MIGRRHADHHDDGETRSHHHEVLAHADQVPREREGQQDQEQCDDDPEAGIADQSPERSRKVEHVATQTTSGSMLTLTARITRSFRDVRDERRLRKETRRGQLGSGGQSG